MSGALHSWYSLPDLEVMAARGTVLEGEIGLERFARLRALLNSCDGTARAKLAFRQNHDDMLLLQLQYQARLELVCQRCLKSLAHKVDEQIEFAVAESEDALAVLPQGMDLIALQGDRFQPATLIEDELIVSLPLVPRHGDDEP
jgi:uncharacterized protein